MEGNRFGLGLAAGLLVGIAIIAGSGGLSALQGGLTMGPASYNGVAQVTSTNTVTYTATVTNSATTALTQTAQTTSFATTTPPSQVALSNLSSSRTSTTPAVPPPSSSNSSVSFTGAAKGATTPMFSSRVENIAHQPLLTDAVVFVPVLLALLLGTVLYSASGRNKEHRSDEPA